MIPVFLAVFLALPGRSETRVLVSVLVSGQSHVEEKGLRRSRASALDRVDCHSSAENDVSISIK